jgi:hypothetical protein
MATQQAIIFELNDSAGFYSTFFFMCQAYIYAKKKGAEFYIKNSNWYYTYEKGWHDYFTTLKNLPSEAKYSKIEKYSHMSCASLPNYTLQEYVDAMKEIYILKPELLSRAQEVEAVTSLFVRRGDKISSREAVLIETADIVKKTSLATKPAIFIQTDDYSVVEELQALLPESEIKSTVPQDKRGSHASAWRKLTARERKQQTEEMLVGLQVCINAPECWSDYTSNVGRFLKLQNPHVKLYSIDNKIPVLHYAKTYRNPAYGFHLA